DSGWSRLRGTRMSTPSTTGGAEPARAAIVTGASTGIGAAIATRLAQSGVDVVVGYLNDQAGAEAVCERAKSAGATAIAVRADVAKQHDCRALVGRALDAFGRLDVLV